MAVEVDGDGLIGRFAWRHGSCLLCFLLFLWLFCESKRARHLGPLVRWSRMHVARTFRPTLVQAALLAPALSRPPPISLWFSSDGSGGTEWEQHPRNLWASYRGSTKD